MTKICCFAGDADLKYGKELEKQILDKCRELVTEHGVNEFWMENHGNFDSLAVKVIKKLRKELKKEYTIKLILVFPYLTKKIASQFKRYLRTYDSIKVAQIPEYTREDFKIIRCNQYMVENSSYLIAFAINDGDAVKTIDFAESKEVTIFNFANNEYPVC